MQGAVNQQISLASTKTERDHRKKVGGERQNDHGKGGIVACRGEGGVEHGLDQIHSWPTEELVGHKAGGS